MLAGQLSVGQLVAAMGIATAMVSGMWQLGYLSAAAASGKHRP